METDRSEREHPISSLCNHVIVDPPLSEKLGFRMAASRMSLQTQGGWSYILVLLLRGKADILEV